MNHDHAYKLLFSEPDTIADLMRGFVHQPWVDALDFSTQEPVAGSYVSDDLRRFFRSCCTTAKRVGMPRPS